MSTQPPPAEGVRLPWDKLPPRIPAALEAWIGGHVADVAMQPGGFSPGVAARVLFDDGRRVFVKAAGPELNPDTPRIFRREKEIVSGLPPGVPVPRLLWSYDEEPDGWVMLVFEDIEGRNPVQPWIREELDRVLQMLVGLHSALTPSPISLAPASRRFAGRLRGWLLLHQDPIEGLDSWSTHHLAELAALEAGAEAAVVGDTLLHFDVRADNILLTPKEVYLVDWPAACVGAAWVDMLAMAPSVAMQGGPEPEKLLQRHPSARAADPEKITAAVAAVAGYFTLQALLPPPPGLPTVRAFQAAQGVVARRWVAQRMGWDERAAFTP